MFFRMMMFVWEFMLDLVAVIRMTDDARDLEIMLLRQQLRIVERKQNRGPQIPRWQKVPLAVLTIRLKDKATNARTTLAESVRLFKPETVIGWHCELVRRKWMFKQGQKPGRPPIDSELEEWILKVAWENPGLGCEKLEGELRKIGFEVSATTIRMILLRHGVPVVSKN
jgi:putative transposase